jgi:multicomponent Na+:H+ antiporter subunit C
MTAAELYGLCGAGLVGVGLYGAILGRSALRRLLGFNLMGSGVFLIFGAVARRGGLAGGSTSDPVPQALVITGLVVAFAATALAVALLVRLAAARCEAGAAGSAAEPAGTAAAAAHPAPDRTGAA